MAEKLAETKVLQQYKEFVDSFRSLCLATVNVSGLPNASYAPFVRDAQGRFYIFLSGLAAHTANLQHTKVASILLIEDENNATEIFARKRLTYHCKAQLIARDQELWQAIAEQFENRFAKTFKMIKSMPDFRMYQLTPQKEGLFVIGFGQAYRVFLDSDKIEHITGDRQDDQGQDSGHGTRAHEIEHKV